jgi:hypothetical protein
LRIFRSGIALAFRFLVIIAIKLRFNLMLDPDKIATIQIVTAKTPPGQIPDRFRTGSDNSPREKQFCPDIVSCLPFRTGLDRVLRTCPNLSEA